MQNALANYIDKVHNVTSQIRADMNGVWKDMLHGDGVRDIVDLINECDDLVKANPFKVIEAANKCLKAHRATLNIPKQRFQRTQQLRYKAKKAHSVVSNYV